MTALERLRASNVWHPEYDLPLSPQNNNPWFYLNLSVLILRHNEPVPEQLIDRILNHLEKCEKEPGLYNRWPNHDLPGGSPDDVTSHDELIGIAALSRAAAKRIWDYLVAHDGEYNNSNQPDPLGKWNLYRFGWFIAWLRSRAGVKLSLWSQVLWSAHVAFDMVKTKPDTTDASGRLLIKTMLSEMDQYELAGFMAQRWRARMKKLGITFKAMVALEPKENPILAELAPEEF